MYLAINMTCIAQQASMLAHYTGLCECTCCHDSTVVTFLKQDGVDNPPLFTAP